MSTLTPRVIVPMSHPIIDLDVVRASINMDADAPNIAMLPRWLKSAAEFAQRLTERPMGDQTLEIALDRFPCGDIPLPMSPAKSIESIKYLDLDNIEQTLPISAYTLDVYKRPCWVVRARGTDWPETLDAINAVRVRYIAGWEHGLPADVETGILMLVGHLRANPQAASSLRVEEIPLGVMAHLNGISSWSV